MHGPAAHRVRIIGGLWRRTPLSVVDAPGLRPTPDRVRETLFNWLGQDLTGLVCADLFAGTGALGLEAASRGAASVHLAETHPAARRALAAVIARLQASGRVSLHGGDCASLLARLRERGERIDIAFVDPPFRQGVLETVMPLLAGVLAPGARIHLESEAALEPAQLRRWLGPDARVLRQARAGQVHYHLLALEPAPDGLQENP
jgi:16S rRNA (guanine(966)-N(2))-methyltransferase RsmD